MNFITLTSNKTGNSLTINVNHIIGITTNMADDKLTDLLVHQVEEPITVKETVVQIHSKILSLPGGRVY